MTVKKTLLSVFLFSAAILLLLHPEVSRTAVGESLRLCTEALLPSLFPFLILTGFWRFPGNGSLFSEIWLPASIGGYPTGASLISKYYKSGSISKSNAEHALFYCCNAGPAFTIGFLGIGLLHSFAAGVFLYGIHLGVSLLLGWLFRPQTAAVSAAKILPIKEQAFDPAQVILLAGKTMGKVFIFVITFGIFVSHLLSLLPVRMRNSAFSAILAAMFELTTGINHLSALTLSMPLQLILCAVFLGWGGICIVFQTMSLLNGTDLSIRTYVTGKLLHGLLSGAAVCLIVKPMPFAVLCLLPIVFLLGKSFSGKKALHGL